MGIREAKFEIEPLGDEVLDGYTSGERRNGWACPLFTLSKPGAPWKLFALAGGKPPTIRALMESHV